MSAISLQSQSPYTSSSPFPQKRIDAMAKIAREIDLSKADRRSVRFDDASTLYVSQELNQIRAGLMEIQYQELKAQRLFPHNTNIDPGAAHYTVKSIDIAGQPRLQGNNSNGDVPRVSLKVGSGNVTPRNYELAYEYTAQEIREAMFARMPLETLKAKACRDQMARWSDYVAFNGDSAAGLLGALGLSSTSTYTPPTTGANGSATWASKDADQVLLDLNSTGDKVITNTTGILEPDVFLLPLSLFRQIETRRVGDGTSATIMAYFTANRKLASGASVTVDWTTFAETAGASSTTRVMAYKKDLDVLEVGVPMAFFQHAPEVRGLSVQTNCEMRLAGSYSRKPEGIAYADGQ